MRTFTLLLLILLSSSLFGGEIYVVGTKYDAAIVVYVTDMRVDADLIVYRTQTTFYSKHRDDWWTFVNYNLPSVVKVYFTKFKNDADVVIMFTNNAWQSGWKKRNVFEGSFKR